MNTTLTKWQVIQLVNQVKEDEGLSLYTDVTVTEDGIGVDIFGRRDAYDAITYCQFDAEDCGECTPEELEENFKNYLEGFKDELREVMYSVDFEGGGSDWDD